MHLTRSHPEPDYPDLVQAFGQLATELVIQVDDRDLQPFNVKQPGLGCTVTFHVAVVVEMVAREIGEHGDIELNACDPILFQRMRRHFHANGMRALFDKIRQQAMHGNHVRGSVRSSFKFTGKPVAERTNYRASLSRAIQDPAEQLSARGLAVRAGHTNYGQLR